MIGIPVILHVKTPAGIDGFNSTVYTDTTEVVENVLVGQPTTDDLSDSVTMYGKSIKYVLGIPKGDNHDWENTEVEFFGKRFRTYGATVQGIEANVPTPWHKKVWVDYYE